MRYHVVKTVLTSAGYESIGITVFKSNDWAKAHDEMKRLRKKYEGTDLRFNLHDTVGY